MRKILFLTAIIAIWGFMESCKQQTNSHEQNKKTTEQKGNRVEQQVQHMIERLNEDLQLTEQQQNELKTYFTESFKKRSETFKKNKENHEQMREQMKKEMEATDAQLKKILTEEQYNTYKENEKKRQEERGQKRRQGGPRQPLMGRDFPR
ncbi:MAG: hypothetical protein NC410_02920 [Oscillibacter sp.]|nr:hypothetical protein [Oscillibacter sp.]